VEDRIFTTLMKNDLNKMSVQVWETVVTVANVPENIPQVGNYFLHILFIYCCMSFLIAYNTNIKTVSMVFKDC